jgi:hypothetical protein
MWASDYGKVCDLQIVMASAAVREDLPPPSRPMPICGESGVKSSSQVFALETKPAVHANHKS